MKKLILILSLAGSLPLASSWAQTLPPNEAGVSMGQLHMTVHDVEAEKKVWTTIGGTPIKIDGTDVMKFPGVLVFLTKGIACSHSRPGRKYRQEFRESRRARQFLCSAWQRGPGEMEGRGPQAAILAPTPERPDHGFVDTSDNLRLEIDEGKGQTVPIASDHIHFYLQPASIPDAQAWYVKLFGADGTNKNQAVLPGIRLAWIATKTPSAIPVPTKGQTLDHVGFEVKNLEAFCKKLEAAGVKLDEPYSKSRHKSYAGASLTDPWGTSLELTEGLNRF